MLTRTQIVTLMFVVLLATAVPVAFAESDNSDVTLTGTGSGAVKVNVEDPNGIAKIVVIGKNGHGIEEKYKPNCKNKFSFNIARDHYRRGKGHEHVILVYDCQTSNNLNFDDGWTIPPGGIPQERKPQQSVIATGDTSPVTPGNTTTVSFHLYNTQYETLTGPSIQIEELPTGWTITGQTADGATWNATEQSWSWSMIENTSFRVPSLSISLPNDTASGTYEIVANATDTKGYSDNFTVPVDVNQSSTSEKIQLQIGANVTNVTVGDTVEFTVTRADTGETVNATIGINGTTFATDGDGSATYTFEKVGEFTATASKVNTTTEQFRTDSIPVSVAQPTATISLQPTTAAMNIGEKKTFTIVVGEVQDGIGSANLRITGIAGQQTPLAVVNETPLAGGNFTNRTVESSPESPTVKRRVTLTDPTTGAKVDFKWVNESHPWCHLPHCLGMATLGLDTPDQGAVSIATVTVKATAGTSSPVALTVSPQELRTETGQSYGVIDTTNASVTVNQTPTVSDISWSPSDPTTGDTIEFTANASDPDGDQLEYEWSFGDGTVGFGRSTTHTYARNGSYNVTVTVTDTTGASTNYSETIRIGAGNSAPTISDISWTPTDPTTADTIEFSATASDPDGDQLTYDWSFGDGRSGTGASVIHSYSDGATYTVTVTVTDPQGAATNYSETINVTEQPQTELSLTASGTTIDQETTTATVSVTLDNTGDELVNLPAVSLGNLPAGWSIDRLDAPNGTVSTDQTQVIYNGINAQETLTPSWTLTLPATVAPGTYNMTANLTVGGDRIQSTIATVTVNPAGVTVALTPESITERPGATTTLAVAVSDFDSGIGSYEFNATMNDTSVATISNVELVGASTDDLGVDVSITSDGSEASVTVPQGDHDNGVIARMSISTQSAGAARVTINNVLIGDTNFTQYQIATVQDAVVQVSERTAPPPIVGSRQPTDPDGDGKFEDLTGDGRTNILDVGAFLQNRQSDTVQNNIDAFDFTGDGAVNILDVGKLLQQVL